MNQSGLPPRQGLYNPANEHDACGVGFVAHIKGKKTHDKRETQAKRDWSRQKQRLLKEHG